MCAQLSIAEKNSNNRHLPDITPVTQETNQEKLAKGKVLDGQGLPLVGVNIRVKETQEGTVTDLDGYYVLKAQPGQTLEFSYIGFKTQEKVIPASLSVDVVLEEDVEALDEVVVVGMGTQRKASVVGAISSVEVTDLKVPTRSLANALSGRMAGVVSVQRSGEIGYDDSEFWIRGISTFGANKTPLVLVDGVERSMNDLDPEEVESVSILKDASATAVYGVRAANGVVLVTTRKGVAAAKPTIEVKFEHGISQLTRMPDLLDGADFMTLVNEANGSEIYSQDVIMNTRMGTDPYLYPNVDWFDEIFKKNSNNTNVSINVRGGGEVARYFVAFSYMDENGNFRDSPTNAYKSNISGQRYNFRTNIDVSITKSTVLDLEVGGSLRDGHYPGTGTSDLFNLAYVATPIMHPVNYPIGTNPDGTTKYGWAGTTSTTQMNPAERLMGSGFVTEFKNQFMGQARVTQDFGKWVPGLKANVAFSFDAYNYTRVARTKRDSYYLANGRLDDGTLDLTQTYVGNEYLGYGRDLYSNRAIELKAQLTYDRLFAEKHRVGGMFMYYQRDYRVGDATDAIGSLPYRKQGFAVRATYAYDDKYMLEFNLGYNGSENFPKSQRFGVFPAGAVGYLISNENFWKESPISNVINTLKIKGSTGLVGAEALPNNRRYAYLTIVGGGLGGINFGDNNTWYAGTGENQLGVQNLTWEKGLKSNVGFELDAFNNHFSLDVDYFHERRTDILIQRGSLPGIVGISDNPFANMGEMRNQGVDGTVEVNSKIGNVSFKIYGNATFTKNKVLEQDEPDWKYLYQNRTGHKYGQHFGLIALGYFKDQHDIDNSPQQMFGNVKPGDVKYMDVNGDGVVDSYDEVPIGRSDIPELVYGFGIQLGYKGFDLGVFFRGQALVDYMLSGEGFTPFTEGYARGNLFAEAMDRWTVDSPSDDHFYPRLSIANTSNNYRSSTKWLYNGSFLRLSDLEFGYNFPKKLLTPLYINGLRLYFHANNLALFSPWKMWDPEIGKGRGDAYPLQRKFNFGIRVTF